MNSPCCSPQREPRSPTTNRPSPTDGSFASVPGSDAVEIPEGSFRMGTDDERFPADREGPVRSVDVPAFAIGRAPVTNAEFAAFVAETGHVSEAERWGWSFVFWSDVPASAGLTEGVVGSQWWRRVEGANWRDIHGPGTVDAAWHADHPVVHMSWNDAACYAAWVGGRLPSEAEWEHAARGGLGDVRFPWGDDEPDDTGYFPCNIWQGRFPQANSVADGHAGTAPARCFEPNGFGLYNMVGNVWEWTDELYRIRSLKKRVQERLKAMKGYRLSKGGSFLCHRSYCYRYRIAARSGISPDSTAAHQGFRVVWDV